MIHPISKEFVMTLSIRLRTVAALCILLASPVVHSQDREKKADPQEKKPEVFSGPQAGERLSAFKMRGVFGDAAGKEIDLVSQAGDKPMAIVFVHEVTRPALGLTRVLMNYAAQRAKDGLVSGVVFLDDDATGAENLLQRAKQALPTQVPIGISMDGREGPGSYGLNRNVALTILIAKDQRVRANFALVQPSIQADAERIAKQMVESLGGGKPPTLADLGVNPEAMPARDRPKADRGNGEFERLLRSLIQKTNDEEAVAKAAAAIEKHIESNEAARKRLGEITSNIVKAGKLEDYGTPAAQKHLKQWAEKFGPPSGLQK
jgi:hypothetical protein